MTDIIMPAGGMAMTEGLVVEWLKQPGDHVAEGEPVVEIETDKATVQIESPASGILGDHRYSVGDVVPVGEVLATVLEPGEAPRAPAPGPDSEPKDRGKGVEPKDEGSHAGQQPGRTAGRTPVPEDLTATRESHRLSPRARREAKATPREMEEARSIETHGGQPVDSVLSHKLLEGFLQDMVLIREFERVATELSHRGKIPGGMHSAAGQEAVAVGSIGALRNTDIVCSSHRSHHHAIAKGLTPRSIMAELYGKATGCLGGRGGHMHLADFSIGLYGSNGIVGGGLGIALGAALGADLQASDQIALAFFGDGGANTGRTWEFVNLAAAWKLPLIIVCENNLYAVETHISRVMAAESVAKRAAGFGLPSFQVDGQDVIAVYNSLLSAADRARTGGGPTFFEALTYRFEGHNESDPQTYRNDAEVEAWRKRDPILRLRQHLESRGMLTVETFEAMEGEAASAVQQAVDFAEESPWPDPTTASSGVVAFVAATEGAT